MVTWTLPEPMLSTPVDQPAAARLGGRAEVGRIPGTRLYRRGPGGAAFTAWHRDGARSLSTLFCCMQRTLCRETRRPPPLPI
jgi:hypothetical protein